MDEKPGNEMKDASLLANAEKFREAVLSSISKKKIPITFPDEVYKNFTEFAKKNSADCYWLAIKQLLDFYVAQTEGDIKTVLIMQQVNELKSRLDELQIKNTQQPKTDKYKTFGQPEEKK